MILLTPERQTQVDDQAQRHGQRPPTHLMRLADAVARERQDYEESVAGIWQGFGAPFVS